MKVKDKIVIDASALLVLLNEEPGGDTVKKYLPNALMSAVNSAAVATVLLGIGAPKDEIQSTIFKLIKEIIPFDQEHAMIAAQFREEMKACACGLLSLGDSACLALAKREKLPVLTANKHWHQLKLSSVVDIRLISN